MYCQFGRQVFGRVLDKTRDVVERQVCKQAILGLGFGMGPQKFGETLAATAPEALALLDAVPGEPVKHAGRSCGGWSERLDCTG